MSEVPQRLRLLLVAVLILQVPGCNAPQPQESRLPDIPGPKSGERLPAYAAVTLEGDSIHIDSLRGNVVLLNFWAPNCAPCVAEFPDFQRLEAEFGGEGLRVVTVSVDRSAARAESTEFLRARGYEWLNLFDYLTTVDRIFGWDTGIPKSILVNRNGTVRVWWTGRLDASLPRNRQYIEAAIADRS